MIINFHKTNYKLLTLGKKSDFEAQNCRTNASEKVLLVHQLSQFQDSVVDRNELPVDEDEAGPSSFRSFPRGFWVERGERPNHFAMH